MQQNTIAAGETVLDPNGLNMPIDYVGAPVKDAQGNIVGALEYVTDISDRKAVLGDIIQVAEAMADGNLTAKATENTMVIS